jgi:GLPGLI family protein
MKDFQFLFLIFIANSIIAQSDILKVKYTETMYMDKMMANIPPQFAANFPKTRDSKKILFTDGIKSLYTVNKEDKEPEPTESSRGGSSFRMGRRSDKTEVFTNSDDLQKITFTDLFNKEFLITEEAEYTWKIHSGEQRDVLGYTCVKATTMQDTIEVIAWYAPKLKSSVGPDGLYGLPGTILAVSYGEDRVILATALEEKTMNAPTLIAPTKGDKVTRQQFNKIRDEKMEEMKKMFSSGAGGGRGMIIRQ